MKQRSQNIWQARVIVKVAASAYLLGVGATAACAAKPQHSFARGIIDTSASPHVVQRSVGMGEVQWTGGFWHDRLQTCRKNSLPAMSEIMRGTEHGQFLHNFKIVAGQAEGRRRGPSFNDGDTLKWLEAIAAMYAATHDAALERQMDEAIEIISAAQRPDGYWQTAVIARQQRGDAGPTPFQNPTQFEAYNLGHLLTAACVHHRATGKTSLLEVARKAADYLATRLENPTPELAACAICPSHYMGVVELYRTTGEKKYLELAQRLIDLRDLVKSGSDDNQDRIPFRRQREAVGHAVRANYLYAGAADVYAETGDRTLLEPLLAIWDDVVFKKMYITGACGALFDGASPDGSKDQEQIGRVHQAYGRPYQLPNSTAHNETCASIGNVLWSWRMLQITGEAKYADVMELALYNAVLAGVSLDGQSYFYTNTLRQLDQMPVELRWSRTRQPFMNVFCCPPNVVRTIAEASNYAYSKSDGKVWVNLYGSSVLDTELADGSRIKLTQETNYPWDGYARLTVDEAPAGETSIRLRIPGWVKEAALSVNGTTVEEPLTPGQYFTVKRNWRAGDVLELHLPMPVRLIESHPLIEESRNHVAVQRGPLVYCLESVDLPSDVKLLEVAIPRDSRWKPRFDADLSGGVTVLEGEAAAIVRPPWNERQLYRDVPEHRMRPVPIKLIPYYAWNNRGRSEMSVWLPLGH